MALSPEQIAAYRSQGFLVVPGLFDPATVDALLAEGTRLCRGELGPLEGLEPVPPGAGDDAVLGRYMTCPMVHKISPLLARTMADARLSDALAGLIGPNVKGVHSQFFLKHAGMPGNAFHQDELFIPTRDRSLVTAWIALDPATVENGCLRVLPGSHRAGVLWPMRRHDNPELDREEEAFGFPEPPESAVPVELAPGSAVFFGGYLVHGSYPNRRPAGFRRALLYVYASAETPMAWSPRNLPVRSTDDYRDIVLVRGHDPYAWKGVSDEGRAYLRRAGPTVQDRLLAALNPLSGPRDEADQALVERFAATGGVADR